MQGARGTLLVCTISSLSLSPLCLAAACALYLILMDSHSQWTASACKCLEHLLTTLTSIVKWRLRRSLLRRTHRVAAHSINNYMQHTFWGKTEGVRERGGVRPATPFDCANVCAALEMCVSCCCIRRFTFLSATGARGGWAGRELRSLRFAGCT